MKDMFIDSGLTHLLAISGLHIGIIVSIIFFLFSFWGKRAVYTLTALILSVYPVFTGFHIPVLRASVMGIIYILSKLKYVYINPLNILFFVAFVVVLLSPYSIFKPGFQLSFIAVFGILISLKHLNTERKSSLNNFFYSVFFISAVAVLFTMPVVIYHFGKFSPISVVSTPFGMIFLYPYLLFSVINLFTFFSIEPFVYLMNIFGNFFIKNAQIFDSFKLFSSGYSPSELSVFLYISILSFLIMARINVYIRLLLISFLVMVFLQTSKTDIDGYMVYSFKGKKKPDVLLITQDRKCFVYWVKERYRIKILMDRYSCRKRFLLVRKNRYFVEFDDYILPGDKKYDVGFVEKKGDLILKIKNRSLLIRNTDNIYNFSNL